MVSVPRSTAPVPELALVADVAGAVTLRLPSGRFTIEAFTEDGGRGSAEVAVEDSRPMLAEIQIEGGGH
jgi:hypothetical protein